MTNLRRLRAPAGTDEANFGEERYRVDNDGTVLVPQEAVAGLVGEGGFEEIDIPHEVPEGFARVVHADPTAACGGTRLPDGSFVVPVAEVKELAAHGFVGVDAALKNITPKADQPAPAGVPGATIADLSALRGELDLLRSQTRDIAEVIERQNGQIAELHLLHEAQATEIDRQNGEIAELHGTLELLTAPPSSEHKPEASEEQPAA